MKFLKRFFLVSCIGLSFTSIAQSLEPTEVTHLEGTKFGYRNKETGERIGKAYDKVSPYNGKYAIVMKGDKWALVNQEVKELTPFKYDKIEPLEKGYAKVSIGDKFGFIDSTGKEICPVKYVRLRSFSEGYATASEEEEGRTGFIDKRGKMFSRFHYDNAGSFQEGLAWVEKAGKVGFIDKKGMEIIQPDYDWVDPDGFKNGVVIVQKKKMGVINHKQKIIVPFEFDDIRSLDGNNQFFITSKGKKAKERFGIYGHDGKEIFPTNFTKITDFQEMGDQKVAKIYFDPLKSKQAYFYINDKMHCVPLEGIACPEH